MNATATMWTTVRALGGMLLLGLTMGNAQGQSNAPDLEEHQVAPDPKPRIRVSGIRTLTTKSRILYRAAVDRPHIMEAAFAFPDRGRWRLVEDIPSPLDVRARYQLGSIVHGVDPGTTDSRILENGERTVALRELALRRSVMLWPRTVSWVREGDLAVADLGPTGRLVARFDGSAELPTSIAGETAAGEEYERFSEIEWTKSADDKFARPTRMTLEAGGAAIWDEEVLHFDGAANYVDSFFIPQDRREAVRQAARPDPGLVSREVNIVPLPARIVRRVQLDRTMDWASRWATSIEIATESDASLKKVGRSLHPALAFELDETDQPTTLVLRLEPSEAGDPTAALPADWSRVPVGQGASLFIAGVSSEVPDYLHVLRMAVEGAGRKAGTPYLVLRRGTEPGRAQLVLPIAE